MFIEVDDLVKEFSITKKKKGIKGAVSGLFRPEKINLRAVDHISFGIEESEIVGYIGPNGAGKSTTVKMMTGIMHPTSGTVRIGGLSVHADRKKVVSDIGVVFGQRTQLYWDLRLGESFELLKRIYQIDSKIFNHNISVLNDVLEIGKLMDIPVRQLSLGQRMRGDLAAAMLHNPSVLFLDEPTIGLDIQAKRAIRKFIADINRLKGTTVILTTHDLDDVEQLCKRLIIINEGRLVEDGPLQAIIDRVTPYRYLVVDTVLPLQELKHPLVQAIKKEDTCFWMKFDKAQISASKLTMELMQQYPIKDIRLKEPEIEDVISEIYKRRVD